MHQNRTSGTHSHRVFGEGFFFLGVMLLEARFLESERLRFFRRSNLFYDM